MNATTLIQPLLAGLSTGAFCLTSCFPFIGSYLGAEGRDLKNNLLLLLEFLAGRLAGYLCFGFLAGYLGEKFDAKWLRLATDVSFIVLSLVLLLYLLGLTRKQEIFCHSPKLLKDRSPAVMGFFMGINLCPPFLLSITYVFSQHDALYGMFYFALFFLSSSVYFFPLIFIGLLSKAREFRTVARMSGFGAAMIFLIYGVYSIIHNI